MAETPQLVFSIRPSIGEVEAGLFNTTRLQFIYLLSDYIRNVPASCFDLGYLVNGLFKGMFFMSVSVTAPEGVIRSARELKAHTTSRHMAGMAICLLLLGAAFSFAIWADGGAFATWYSVIPATSLVLGAVLGALAGKRLLKESYEICRDPERTAQNPDGREERRKKQQDVLGLCKSAGGHCSWSVCRKPRWVGRRRQSPGILWQISRSSRGFGSGVLAHRDKERLSRELTSRIMW